MALDEACTQEEAPDAGARWRPRAPGWAVNTADALSPTFAPVAARWDAEADRRRQLRTPENLKSLMDAQRAHNSARSIAARAANQSTAARKESSNPVSAERRAARVAVKAAKQHKRKARAALTIARADYPATLLRRSVQFHGGHSLVSAVASWAMSGAQNWTVWPVSASAAAVGLHASALWLGRREVSVAVDDGMSAEERQLAARLDPSFWVEHAGERGLAGTVTTPAKLVTAGLECEVRLDGTWTLKGLNEKLASIRNLLGARTSLPVTVSASSRGGWAVIRLRTRSATDGVDLKWSPGAAFGIDTVTGDDVRVPLGQRMLIAGRSGSGKSWSARPMLYDASEGPLNVLVIIDMKQVEGRLWDHRARVASTPEDVVDLVQELVEEMTERLGMIPKGEDTITPTESRPRITVFVDEGAEVMSRCDKVEIITGYTDKDVPITEKVSAVEGLESIARMGRAPIIDLWWATQKPTMSGASAGIPPQIAPQLSTVVCLAVRTPTETRTVLGEDAQAKGWNADELPAPGYALVRTDNPADKPNPVKTRALSPKEVIALPDQRIWRRGAASPDPERKPLHLVKEQAQVIGPELPGSAAEVHAQMLAADMDLTDNQQAVLKIVRDGATSNAEIARTAGLNPGSVARAVDALVKRDLLVKTGSDIREMLA